MFFSSVLPAILLLTHSAAAWQYQPAGYRGLGCYDPCDPCGGQGHYLEDTGYLYASCHLMPNPAMPGLTEQVTGYIYFKQKAKGGEVTIKLDVSGFDTTDTDIFHGYHIHQYGNIEMDCAASGPHYNHSGPTYSHDGRPNVGDIGNIMEDAMGNAQGQSKDGVISLAGKHSIYGRAIVIHASKDETVGHGSTHGSTHGTTHGMTHGTTHGPTHGTMHGGTNTGGHSGHSSNPRIACCKIVISDGSAW